MVIWDERKHSQPWKRKNVQERWSTDNWMKITTIPAIWEYDDTRSRIDRKTNKKSLVESWEVFTGYFKRNAFLRLFKTLGNTKRSKSEAVTLECVCVCVCVGGGGGGQRAYREKHPSQKGNGVHFTGANLLTPLIKLERQTPNKGTEGSLSCAC